MNICVYHHASIIISWVKCSIEDIIKNHFKKISPIIFLKLNFVPFLGSNCWSWGDDLNQFKSTLYEDVSNVISQIVALKPLKNFKIFIFIYSVHQNAVKWWLKEECIGHWWGLTFIKIHVLINALTGCWIFIMIHPQN